MKKIKNFINKFNSAVPFAVGSVILGVILLILPGTSLKTVCIVLGIATLLKGVIKLTGYLKARATSTEKFTDLFFSILTFIVALILIIHPERILSIIPVIIGLIIFIYGIVTLAKRNASTKTKITSGITIVVGLTVLVVPFTFAEIITAIIGAGFIILGIIILINTKQINNITNDLKNAPLLKDEKGYTEVEYSDVKYKGTQYTDTNINEPEITEVNFKDVK